VARNQRGSRNNNTALEEAVVAKALGWHARGVPQRRIGALLGIERQNVWNLVHRVSWAHVEPDMTTPLPPPEPPPAEKWCPACQAMRPMAEFHGLTKAGKLQSYCRPCKLVKENRRFRSCRETAIRRLGGACECCGESTHEFLALDHINGGGTAQRKVISGKVLVKLVARGQIDGIRLLCHNCNLARGFYGFCPHERAARSERSGLDSRSLRV